MTVAPGLSPTGRATASGAKSWPRPLQLSALAGLVVGVGVAGAYLFWRTSDVANLACQENPGHRLLPDYLLLAWSVGCVVVGRSVGPRMHTIPEDSGAERIAGIVGILTVMVLLAAVMFAMVYEGIGVQASLDQGIPIGTFHQLEPITYYVRCAIFYDKSSSAGFGIATYAIFGLTGFLAGHWLWPLRPPTRIPDDVENAPVVEPTTRHFVFATLLTVISVAVIVVVGYAFLSDALYANPNTVAAAQQLPTHSVDVAETEGTFHNGILAVIAFVTLFFLLIASLDLYFAWRRWDCVGLRVQRWAEANVWFVFCLLSLAAALAAHFGANEIQYS